MTIVKEKIENISTFFWGRFARPSRSAMQPIAVYHRSRNVGLKGGAPAGWATHRG